MKANELRIGNYVELNNELSIVLGLDVHNEVKIEQLNNIGVIYLRLDLDVSPIPLDEEWLVKFGFDIEKNPEEIIYTKRFDVLDSCKFEIKRKVGYDIFYFETDDLLKQVLKIHQLQNLYFALTGEELTIKTK